MRFDEIRVCAQNVGAINIPFIVGRAEDDRGDNFAFMMVLQPFEQMKTVHAGHFQIAKQNVEEKGFVAIRELFFGAQISEGLALVFVD